MTGDSAAPAVWVGQVATTGAEVSALCDAADEHAASRGAGPQARYALRLVVEELVSNVAKYAGASGPIEVRVEVRTDAVLATIIDDGVPFDPSAAAAPAAPDSLAEASIGGLGLTMVRASVRRLGYRRESGRNVVEAEIPQDPA